MFTKIKDAIQKKKREKQFDEIKRLLNPPPPRKPARKCVKRK